MNIQYLWVTIIGLVAGVLSGLFGIGGGVIIVLCLTAFLGLDQKSATGTSLAAMVPPVGILAVWEYYRRGQVNIPFAVIIGLGILVGALVGARLTAPMSPIMMKRLFGGLLTFIGLRYIFG